MPDSAIQHWKINKEIPVGIIVTLIIQTVFVIMFIVRMDARIQRLEEQRTEDKVTATKLLEMPDRLTRNEYETLGLKDGVKRLEGKIDQLSISTRKEQPGE